MDSVNRSLWPYLSSCPRRTLWWMALCNPLVLAPAWCAMTGQPLGTLGTARGYVLLCTLTACCVTDLACRKIFNWVTYSAIFWAIGINLLGALAGPAWGERLGAVGLSTSLGGLFGCFLVMLCAYSLARGGAGDVKLAAAIGAMLGFEQGLLAIACSYVLAGIVVLGWSIWTRGPLTLTLAMGRLIGSMLCPQWVPRPTPSDKLLLNTPVPLAGFFAAGTLVVVLNGAFIN